MKLKDIYNPKVWAKKEKKERKKLILQNVIYKIGLKRNNGRNEFKYELGAVFHVIKKILRAIIYLSLIIMISIIIDNVFMWLGWKIVILRYIQYDRQVFINFLVSSVSIAGFLIALFYANLSGIFTSRYAHISSRVSKELLNEYTVRKYINSIQNYIIVILLTLLLNIIGIYTDIIISTIIIILTIRIIIVFIELSKRIFIYSDTVIIGENTMRKTSEILRAIQVGAYKYDNQAFQNYHNKQVTESINTLDDLSLSLIKDKDYEGLSKLLNINLVLIANYSEIKNKIPYNSLWFPKMAKGKMWFNENDTEIITALNTGTSLKPKLIMNKYFFEDRLFEMNLKIVEYLIREKQFKNVYLYFEGYHECFDNFAKSGDMDYWYKNIHNNIELIINKIDFANNYEDEHVIGLLDLVSLYKIDFCLSFSNYVEEIIKIIKKINWENFNKREMLRSNVYFMNNEQFYDFTKKLENERYLEKKLITSREYILDYVNCQINEYLGNLIDIFPETLIELNKISKKLLDNKLLIQSAVISSRIIEINNKILYRLEMLKYQNKEVMKFQKGNYKYKELDFSEITNRLKKHYLISIEQYSKIVVGLYFEKYTVEESRLDFIGQAYYQLTFLMLDLIYENDYDCFEKLYPNFVAVCSISNKYIRDIIPANWNHSYVLKKYTMATINFMNISGFAIYYSHLTKDDRWEKLVKRYANEVISKEKEKGNFVNNCKTSAEIYSNYNLMTSLIDTNVISSVENFVRNTKLIKYKNVGPFGYKVIDCEDELIRKFNYDEYGFSNDLFEIYLYYCINDFLDEEEKYKTRFNWAEGDM